jgi:hypothetical protein
MIIEIRTYTVLPNRLGAWLALWESKALPVQSEVLGGFLGMYVTDIGPINEVVHLWSYASLAERESRRARLEMDPRWAIYRSEVEQLAPITLMQSRVVRPTAFSPHITATGRPA